MNFPLSLFRHNFYVKIKISYSVMTKSVQVFQVVNFLRSLYQLEKLSNIATTLEFGNLSIGLPNFLSIKLSFLRS